MKRVHFQKLKDTKGIALVLSFAIMAALMVIVITYLFVASTGIKRADKQTSNMQALFVADAGLQYAIYRLHYDSNWDEDGGTAHVIGAGSFVVDVRDITGGTPPTVYKRITSTGTVAGLSRVVKQDVAVTP